MGNLVIGYRNRIDDATLSGGSFVAACPITNVQDKRITRVARSSDATAASTRFDIDLGAALACQGFAVVNHNASAAATWTITGGTSSGASDTYSGSARSAVQMSTSADVLEWEDSGFWEGTGDEWVRNMHPLIYVHTAQITARYWRIQITDTANADGYVQFGRVYIGPVLIPALNDSYGRGQGFKDFTEFEQRAAYFDGEPDHYARLGALLDEIGLERTAVSAMGDPFARQGRKAKRAEIALDWLTNEEQRALRSIMRRDGADADVLFASDATDAAAQQEFGFLGTVTAGLESIVTPVPSYYSGKFTIEERL